MNKIKILLVNGGLMDRGGISSFICNYLKNFDFEIFDITIAVHGNKVGSRDNELEKVGCKIIYLPIKSKSYLQWKKSLSNAIVNGNFDIIHANADAGNGPILKIANKYKIPVRISHSHSIQFLTGNKIRIILNKLQKKQILKYANQLFACSNKAGEWLYGKKVRFIVINNAIDFDKYKFNEDVRNEVRKKLNLDDRKYVIGHIGCFDYQKNHKFILDIAEKFKTENVVFLLIGDGHLRAEIESEINKRSINNIIMTGEINNVSEYLNAMDCFILPSLFEGLGMVAIEAQVNGLKCIISSTVPEECCISTSTEFLSIENSLLWSEKILSIMSQGKFNRITQPNDSFNLEIQSIKLQKKYIELLNDLK